tara:strand:+ start:283 stop:1428 length:1146 start_codon:yes stop_codon:yes gene_type:complete
MFPNKMSVLPNPRGEPTVAGNTIAPLANYVNNDTPIFALNGSGGGGGTGNPAPQFVATGIANSGGFKSTGAGGNVVLKQGVFETTAVRDPLTNDVDVLRIKSSAGLNRWELGIFGSEDGANVGSDLFLRPSSDAGAALPTALQILRDNSDVIVTSGNLYCNGPGATVGALGDVGGGILNIRGNLGLGRVYDEVYNPPPGGGGGVQTITGSEYIAVTGTASNPILTATSLIPASLPFTSQSTQQQGVIPSGFQTVALSATTYTAPRSGLYLLSASFVVNVSTGITGACSIGTYDYVGITLFNLPTAVTYAVNLKPWSMLDTDTGGQDYNLTNTQVVSLVEGTAYTLTAIINNCTVPNAMVFPSTGGAGNCGCRFIANIVPLC